jgi:hypothetical protein
MDEALRRAGWVVLAVLLIAGLLGYGSDRVFNSRAASSTPMIIRDVVRTGEHHLRGKIIVRNTCDELHIKARNLGAGEYLLEFTTWPEPSVPCIKKPTDRVFDAVIFAPSTGVRFIATLDKVPLPIAVYAELEDDSVQ